MSKTFDTVLEETDGVIAGPLRSPSQMLSVQEYDGHASIHDNATAQKLGFKGGTIEGPTHFSQFAPLAYSLWGDRFLTNGCISAHYRAPVYEGERVRAFLSKPAAGANEAEIFMLRENEDEILRGTVSVGPEFPLSALERRLSTLTPLEDPVILADVKRGSRAERSEAMMAAEQHMGELYPFSLKQKLAVITEPSPLYTAVDNPWRRPIIPLEMISVLMQYGSKLNGFATRGPAVGLFADQEIRLLAGPLFVGEPYEVEREVVFLSGSKRTESMWVRATLFAPGSTRALAVMLLNLATLKESYARYQEEYTALYGASH